MKRRQKLTDGLYPGDDLIPAPVNFGRKVTEIDLEQLKEYAKFQPKLMQTAAFFKIDEDTLKKIIKRNFGKTFSEFVEEQFVHTQNALERKALGEALKDPPNTKMLDQCLKKFCGWSDKVENVIHGQVAISHAPIVVFALDDNDNGE